MFIFLFYMTFQFILYFINAISLLNFFFVFTFTISVKVNQVRGFYCDFFFTSCSFSEGVVDSRWHRLTAHAQKGFGFGVLL